MISFIFKCINFGIITALILYGFKRYALPFVLSQMKASEKHAHDLHNDRDELFAAQVILEQEVRDQEQQCVSLSKKIDQWNEVVLHELRKKEIKIQDTMEIVEQRRKRQSAEYSVQKTAHAILGCVDKKLKQELITYFADEQLAQKYIQHILSSIEKK